MRLDLVRSGLIQLNLLQWLAFREEWRRRATRNERRARIRLPPGAVSSWAVLRGISDLLCFVVRDGVKPAKPSTSGWASAIRWQEYLSENSTNKEVREDREKREKKGDEPKPGLRDGRPGLVG